MTAAAARTKTVCITGGTGFLGEHTVRALRARGGYDLRVLARGHSTVLETLGVQIIRSDMTAADAAADAELLRALDGCDGVFHLAGVVSRSPKDSQRMMRLHVDGSRRLMVAAASAGVRRIVLASTSGTIAVATDDRPRDETAPYAIEIISAWPYYVSKVYQEKTMLQLGDELGIEVVVVSPSLLLGPGDRRMSSTGDVDRFLKRKIPICPDGGINFVDVRDAAAATVEAFEQGHAGERYLLGGPNWTMKEFFGRLSRVSKVPAPWIRLPSRMGRWGASVLDMACKQLGKEAPVDRQSVEMGEHYWYVDARKARRELGFVSREPGETLGDTVRYLRDHTY